MDWKIRSYSIKPTGELLIYVTVQKPEEAPEAGDVVQVGVDLPPIPGLRGSYVATEVAVSQRDGDPYPVASVRLGRASKENLELAQQRRIEGIGRSLGTNPNWADVWDRLDFLPQNRRSAALRIIQAEHRDHLDATERARRIDQLAAERAERLASEREQHEQTIEQRAREINAERAFAKYKPPTKRRIDLEGDDE